MMLGLRWAAATSPLRQYSNPLSAWRYTYAYHGLAVMAGGTRADAVRVRLKHVREVAR